MKKYLTLLLLASCFSIGYAQEICNNSIDDDGDGLIDLNDSDCVCSTSTTIPSLIPNPSFELYNGCPDGFSQLYHAQNWIQATDATSDYFNCGYQFPAFAPAGLSTYPDGNGIVGALYLQNWKEYVGATLLEPMLAGTTYRLTFQTAVLRVTGYGDPTNYPVSALGPVDITLFGCNNGANLPVSTLNSPNTVDATWNVIGSISYMPVSQWAEVTIEFTPTIDINAIMFGPPQILPATYPQTGGNGFPYFLYDSLLLNKLELFDPIAINRTGDFCSNNVVLHIENMLPEYTYQWYLNGVSIPGATSASLPIANYIPGAIYTATGQSALYCISAAIGLDTLIPDPPVVVAPLDYCQYATAPALTAVGNNLLWYANATGGVGSTTAPVVSTAVPGIYHFYVSQTCILESQRADITVVVNPSPTPNFPQPAAICYGTSVMPFALTSPNGVAGTWTPATIDSTQNGTYTFNPNPGICGLSQTLNVSVLAPVNFGLNGGCNSRNYAVQAFNLDGSTFDESLVFQWYDANNLPIGTNQASINITELINASTELPFEISLQITDANGCEYVQNTTIDRIFCDIPKGISPNSDGFNEFFDLRGLGVTHIEIFNRYGTKVYGKDNYTTQWNGQTDDGKELPDAAYYYYLTFENQKPKTGWVYVTR